jgi:hypothetical protein
MNKKSFLTPLALFFSALLFSAAFFIGAADAAKGQRFSPYLKVSTLEDSMDNAAAKVKEALAAAGFEVIGEYNPEEKPGLKAIAYTRKDLQDITLKVKDRGLLASILKVGLYEVDGKINVSMVNPEYLFRGYLMKEFYNHEQGLQAIATEAQNALKSVGGEFEPFGGNLKAKKLEHYHYKFGMEYFDDPVTLKEYESFEKGLETIRKNLAEKKGGAFEVFSLVREDAKVAVFGIGLGDEKTGEKFFLPKIGEHHIAAMPYEIILTDGKATMLHGRFRIAIHWPTLSMVFGKYSFTKIMSTPGAIKKTMLEVTK